MKTIYNTLAILLAILSAGFLPAHAQDQGFIYGKVTTIDDRTFEGALRWGKEEVFWSDHFNASKEENDNVRYLSREQREDLEDRYYRRNNGWLSAWVETVSFDRTDFKHQFVTEFGNIKSIEPHYRNSAIIKLQNGEEIEVEGEGYNDLGSDIKVIDPEIGEIELNWSRIEKIEFMETPKGIKNTFGQPLFGTVETYEGTFTGMIQWDHDERVSSDKLDGDTRDGDVSIEFGKIKSIERDGFNGSIVELNSGRTMELDDSNDVDSGNRGIIVTTAFGRVDIPWREFKKVTFTDKPNVNVMSYGDYKNQKKLTGTVLTTNGEKLTGQLVYDLDEAYNYEILQAKDDEIEYLIAFKNIRTIVPKNYDFSEIELKDGKKITLGESQDVSDKNTGILIFSNNSKDPKYVKWENVESVSFD